MFDFKFPRIILIPGLILALTYLFRFLLLYEDIKISEITKFDANEVRINNLIDSLESEDPLLSYKFIYDTNGNSVGEIMPINPYGPDFVFLSIYGYRTLAIVGSRKFMFGSHVSGFLILNDNYIVFRPFKNNSLLSRNQSNTEMFCFELIKEEGSVLDDSVTH